MHGYSCPALFLQPIFTKEAVNMQDITSHPYKFPRYTRHWDLDAPADIASQFPELMPEWADERDPATILPNSHKYIKWCCPLGHRYEAMPYARVRGTGCPYCANRKVLPGFNDLASADPEVAAEWHPDLNGELTPSDVTRGNTKRVWWKCRFGHEWRATVYSRTRERKAGCPYCMGRYRDKR